MQTALKENIGYCRLQFSETNKEKIAKKIIENTHHIHIRKKL